MYILGVHSNFQKERERGHKQLFRYSAATHHRTSRTAPQHQTANPRRLASRRPLGASLCPDWSIHTLSGCRSPRIHRPTNPLASSVVVVREASAKSRCTPCLDRVSPRSTPYTHRVSPGCDTLAIQGVRTWKHPTPDLVNEERSPLGRVVVDQVWGRVSGCGSNRRQAGSWLTPTLPRTYPHPLLLNGGVGARLTGHRPVEQHSTTCLSHLPKETQHV